MLSLDQQRAQTRRHIEDLRSEIALHGVFARASGPLPADQDALIAYVLGQCQTLLGHVDQADRHTLDSLNEHVDVLADAKLFVMPTAEMRALTRARLSEMQEWGIPDTWLRDVSQVVTDIQKTDWVRDPYSVRRVEKEFVYWDEYTDWYFGRMAWISGGLLAITTVALLLSFLAFEYLGVFWGFLLAGIAGTGVSILLKLPPMSAYGQVAPLGSQICVRYAAGIVGVTVGAGFLALGLVTINLPGDRSLASILASYNVSRPVTTHKDGTQHESNPADRTSAKETKESLPGAPNTTHTGSNRADLDGAANVIKPPQATSTPNDTPTHISLLILLSIALVLGFSERSLTSFETTLFGGEIAKK